MKMQTWILAGLLCVAPTLASANAADIPECANIVKACEGAGFMPGDHKKNGKGLWVDCVGAIGKGKTVAGVSSTQAEAQACQNAHKAKKAEKKK